MQVFIYCKITLQVSGAYRTHHQEYIKLYLKLLVQVVSRVRATTFRQRRLIRYCCISLDLINIQVFLLSLLASFRLFNDEQKFLARMEIPKIMRQIKL